MAKKAKGSKIRIDFRKNHQVRKRPNDLTRKFQQDRLEDSPSGERISGKGELTRRRTILGGHGTETGMSAQFGGDGDTRVGRVLRVHGLESIVARTMGQSFGAR